MPLGLGGTQTCNLTSLPLPKVQHELCWSSFVHYILIKIHKLDINKWGGAEPTEKVYSIPSFESRTNNV